ncbi:hypothetical protein Tco_1391397 [Tanacetum coccineum]
MRKYRFSPFKPANETNSSFRTIEVESLCFQSYGNTVATGGLSFQWKHESMADASELISLLSGRDNIVEEEDRGWICFLGGNNSSGTKKYRGSNSSDGGNTGDGVKIAGGEIGSCGGIGKISSFLEFSEKSEEMFPGVAGK